jgi:ubiquitin-like protein Pup
MAEQERKAKRAPEPQQPEEAPKPNTAIAAKGKVLKKSLDEVLDDIDEVLEDNAEEFVKSYVQRGGE